jgi:putative membrane protein
VWKPTREGESMATDLDAKTTLLIVLGALLVLPLLWVGTMGGPMMYGMGGGMWGGGTGTSPGWFLLVNLLNRVLVLAAVVVVGYLVYRGVTGSGDGGDDAVSELRLAYARGDLSDEEFERRRERLHREE